MKPDYLTNQPSQEMGAVSTKRSFLPGQRFRIVKEMERQVRGFREVSRELTLARRLLEQQEKMRNNVTNDKVVQTSFYKSVVGTR